MSAWLINMDFSLSDLKRYMVTAQAPHAFGTAEVTKDAHDGAWVISHTDGDWRMKDCFYGGQPYGGQETIFYKDKAVWVMVYYGRVYDTKLSANYVYGFLRRALQHPPNARPYRGPASFKQDTLNYKNISQGEIDEFSGEEMILENGTEIYSAVYFGGLVDQTSGIGY
jgi:hypothetical protein